MPATSWEEFYRQVSKLTFDDASSRADSIIGEDDEMPTPARFLSVNG